MSFYDDNKYELGEKLGRGSFAQVFRIIDKETKKQYALKVERRSKSTIQSEHRILSQLQGFQGFPKIYEQYDQNEYVCMIIQLLGRTIDDIFRSTKHFDLGTVLQVGMQLFQRLKVLHSIGYIHRDLKPHQLVMSRNNTLMYLIDFGLSKKQQIQGSPYEQRGSFVGNPVFASTNVHKRNPCNRRDDIESVVYILVYLIRGTLDWRNVIAITKQEKWQKIGQIKIKTPIAQICEGCPQQFQQLLQYARSLQANSIPDYDYIYSLLYECSVQNSTRIQFQWYANHSPKQTRRGRSRKQKHAKRRRARSVRTREQEESPTTERCTMPQISDEVRQKINQIKPPKLPSEEIQSCDQSIQYTKNCNIL